jgi:hypothetical protein
LLLLERIPTVAFSALLAVAEFGLRQESGGIVSAAFDGVIPPSIQPNLRTKDPTSAALTWPS